MRAQLQEARAQLVGARVLSNPWFTYDGFDLLSRKETMFSGPAQHEVQVEVPLLLFGQRAVRISEANRQIEAKAAEIEASWTEVVLEVWQSFSRLLAHDERVRVLSEARSEVGALLRLVEGRAEAGEASPYDVLRMRLEAASIEAKEKTAESERLAAAGKLGVILGFPDWQPQAVGSLQPVEVPWTSEELATRLAEKTRVCKLPA